MDLARGHRLGDYEILEPIGAGGMGQVYLARDTRLDRQVAIKVLPPAVAENADRLDRFEREAKLLASLNHPNIATIHGLHDQQATRFLALEYVPGEDLAERLIRGPLPLDEALQVARGVADALRAAHDAGVIHRDLKPANIRITPAGEVRVLDFGLAKALSPSGSSGEFASSTDPAAPTMTVAGTEPGVVMGTVAYMSPEQARGRVLDRRTDLWSFGCVLFETLTGRPVFGCDTVSDTMAAILRNEPAWSALPAGTPGPVRRLLRRCLQKDTSRRLHDIGDALLELDDALDPTHSAETVPAVATAAATRLPWVLTGLFAILAALLLVLRLGGDTNGSAVEGTHGTHLSINVSGELVLMSGGVGGLRLAISPDGSRVAFSARDEDTVKLYLRELTSDRVVEVPESRGAGSPFFSPDGRWVGFFSNAKLRKVAVGGGTPVALAEARSGRGGIWLGDDTIVFAPEFDSGLFRIDAGGGEPSQVTAPDRGRNERSHRWPALLPGGRAVLFTLGTLDKPGVYDDALIVAVDLESGERRTLIEGGSIARYAAGHLFYAREGVLLAVPFDADALEITGPPVVALEGVGGEPTSGAVDFALTRSGTLAYVPATPEDAQPELVRVDRDGRAETLPFEGRPVLTPRLSPEGRRLAVTVGRGLGDGDLWIYDLERRRNTRLTFHTSGAQPIWSADGRSILYGYTRGGEEGVVMQAADGSGELVRRAAWIGATVLFPDALHPVTGDMLTSIYGGKGGTDILVHPRDGGEPGVVLDGPHSEGALTFSPGGRWFAYVSDQSGRYEIYVRPYPGPGGRFQLTTDGGRGPVWSDGGDEIFYTDGDRVLSIPVQTEPTFSAGEPRTLFRVPLRRDIGPWPDYDVSDDGKTFYLFQRSPDAVESRQIDLRFRFARSLPDPD